MVACVGVGLRPTPTPTESPTKGGAMNEITLKQGEIPAINPALLAEEIAAALGIEVSVQATHEGGTLTAATLARRDGAPFTRGQIEIVHALIAAHDDSLLSSEQWAEQERQHQRQT